MSADELPSVYRSWTARRFLAQVEPRIREVQGKLPEGWTTAFDGDIVALKPLEATPPTLVTAAASLAFTIAQTPPSEPVAPAKRPEVPGARRTFVSDAFLVMLLVGAILNVSVVIFSFRAPGWFRGAFLLLQTGSAVGVLVERYRRRLAAGLEKLAAAKLVWSGLMFYAVVLINASMSRHGAARVPINGTSIVVAPYNQTLATFAGAADVILVIVGLAMILLPSRRASTGMFSTEL